MNTLASSLWSGFKVHNFQGVYRHHEKSLKIQGLVFGVSQIVGPYSSDHRIDRDPDNWKTSACNNVQVHAQSELVINKDL